MANIEAPGVIEPGALYTVSEVQQRLRAGAVTWSRLLDRGLRVTKIGGKSYVLADDLIRLFKTPEEAVAP